MNILHETLFEFFEPFDGIHDGKGFVLMEAERSSYDVLFDSDFSFDFLLAAEHGLLHDSELFTKRAELAVEFSFVPGDFFVSDFVLV